MSDFLDRLYEDIGVKIKDFAKKFFVGGIILAVIGMFVGIFYIIVLVSDGESWAIFLLPCAPFALLFAIIAEYIASIPIYAVGEIVDNIVRARKNTDILVGVVGRKIGDTETQEICEEIYEEYKQEEEREEYKDEMPPNLNIEPNENQWRCPACKAINENYVGTCGCGQFKPLS